MVEIYAESKSSMDQDRFCEMTFFVVGKIEHGMIPQLYAQLMGWA